MKQTLYLQWVEAKFIPLTLSITNTLNGTKKAPLYLHRTYLRKMYSVTGEWETLSTAFTNVAADVVTMDSPLPLKMRDATAKATGEIPKIGMMKALTEKQMRNIDTMIALGGNEGQVEEALFADTAAVITGIPEQNELRFLEGLSTGVTSVPEANNTGAAYRVAFGYLGKNQKGTSGAVWSTFATSTPLDDIQVLLDEADLDGNTPTTLWLDRTALTNFKKSSQVKESRANSQGIVADGADLPNLDNAQASEVIRAEFGLDVVVVNRTVKTEKNGVRTNTKPWADGRVVITCTNELGGLVWTKLAEMGHPAEQVTYSTVDDFVLVSKYHDVNPLREYTSSQAMVLPVIGNPEMIYTLDTKTVQG